MAIKLIAIDMDGTLLNPQHEISPRVKQAIQAARDNGVAVVLATGRPFIGIQRYLAELGLQQEGQYCISNNGALVQKADTGECVAEVAVSFDDYLYYEQMARDLGVHFQALTQTHLYTANKDISRYTIHEASLTGIPLRYRPVEEMDAAMTRKDAMSAAQSEFRGACGMTLRGDAREVAELPEGAFSVRGGAEGWAWMCKGWMPELAVAAEAAPRPAFQPSTAQLIDSIKTLLEEANNLWDQLPGGERALLDSLAASPAQSLRQCLSSGLEAAQGAAEHFRRDAEHTSSPEL